MYSGVFAAVDIAALCILSVNSDSSRSLVCTVPCTEFTSLPSQSVNDITSEHVSEA